MDTEVETKTKSEESSETVDATGGQSPEKSGDKLFTQADLDRLIDDRLKRERTKAEESAKKAREEAEAKALEEQKEFQKLAEQRAAKVAELEPQAEKAQRFETALLKLLESEKAEVPEHVATLLEKLDPVEQLEWIASNRDKLKPAEPGQPEPDKTRGVPKTPQRGDARGATEEQKRAAQQQAARFYRNRF
jgi:hypothetical protein